MKRSGRWVSYAASAAMLSAAFALAGCAPLPPTPAAAPPASISRPPGTPAVPSRPAVVRPAVAPVDSTPSAEALAVLGSIPEPLRPDERIAPPSATNGATAPGASADTDSAGADVPVPEPTQPLGERRRAATDSTQGATGGAPPTSTSQPPAGAAAAPSVTPSVAPSVAKGDTCWRVQVLAPLEADKAEQARATAASLMLVPMVVEQEQGRYKVRTKDCLSRDAADLLRRRAVETGFTQAFRIAGVKR